MRNLFFILLIYFPFNLLFSKDLVSTLHSVEVGKDHLSSRIILATKPKPERLYRVVTGYILDNQENKPISKAKISLKLYFDDPGEVFYADTNGFFSIKVPLNHLFLLEARHDEYNVRYRKIFYKENKVNPDYFKVYLMPHSKKTTKKIAPAFIEPKNIPMKVAKGHAILDVSPVYFFRDETVFDRESIAALDEIIAILNANPKLILEIASHTEGGGPNQYEMDLTQKRSDYIKNYFLRHEINSDRLIAKGYGSLMPIYKCKKFERCSEKQSLTNRRTEFVILNPML